MDDQCAMHSDSLYRNRLRALLGVDQLVGAVADKLLAHDLLDSTYFLYSSDHGFHLGEMSMPASVTRLSDNSVTPNPPPLRICSLVRMGWFAPL